MSIELLPKSRLPVILLTLCRSTSMPLSRCSQGRCQFPGKTTQRSRSRSSQRGAISTEASSTIECWMPQYFESNFNSSKPDACLPYRSKLPAYGGHVCGSSDLEAGLYPATAIAFRHRDQMARLAKTKSNLKTFQAAWILSRSKGV